MSISIIESLKEILRLALFAGVSAVVASLITSITAMESTEIVFIVLLAVLRFIDKWLHTSGRAMMGLSRF